MVRISKRIGYVFMFFFLTGALLLSSQIVSYGQQQTESVMPKNTFFAPYMYLQYGPAPDDAIPVLFRSANFSQNNHTLTFYSPSTAMNTYAVARSLYRNDTIQPTFDSYFVYNRLIPQFIPRTSNASVTIARILNNQAEYITQTKLSGPITLPSVEKDNVTKTFLIPTYLRNGFYLVKSYIYFPEYRIHALYSDSAHIYNNVTRGK